MALFFRQDKQDNLVLWHHYLDFVNTEDPKSSMILFINPVNSV